MQVCCFLNYIQSVHFATGWLKSSCGHVSKIIKTKMMYSLDCHSRGSENFRKWETSVQHTDRFRIIKSLYGSYSLRRRAMSNMYLNTWVEHTVDLWLDVYWKADGDQEVKSLNPTTQSYYHITKMLMCMSKETQLSVSPSDHVILLVYTLITRQLSCRTQKHASSELLPL